jgi:D-alanyl-D-alanine carboxypeptidase
MNQVERLIEKYCKEEGATKLVVGDDVSIMIQGLGDGRVVIHHDTPDGCFVASVKKVEDTYEYEYLLRTRYFEPESKKDDYKSDTVLEEFLYGIYDDYVIEK